MKIDKKLHKCNSHISNINDKAREKNYANEICIKLYIFAYVLHIKSCVFAFLCILKYTFFAKMLTRFCGFFNLHICHTVFMQSQNSIGIMHLNVI